MTGINTYNISDQEVLKILESEEGHFGDLKAKEIRPSKLSESLSAFANAEGGELFIGISEDKREQFRSWDGFSNQEAANGHIQIFEELFPLGGGCTLSFLQNTNQKGRILKVDIQKSRDIKKASNGKVYIRRGSQNLPITTQEGLEILRRDKGITSFETETVPADQIIITNSVTIINFMLEVIPSSEPEMWLKKQQLLIGGRPTVAGVVLFSDEPQAVLPKRSGIKIYRPRSWDRPLYAFRGGFKGAGASSTDSNIAANIERGF